MKVHTHSLFCTVLCTLLFFLVPLGALAVESSVPVTFTVTDQQPTTTPEAGGNNVRHELQEIPLRVVEYEVTPRSTDALIGWRTQGPSRSTVRWGTTPAYELGVFEGTQFADVHERLLSGLRPATRYYFSLEGENRRGERRILVESSFVTLPPADTDVPLNVTGLTATRDGDDVVLSWDVPSDAGVAFVRVLAHHRFFPSDVADGRLVYEGSAHTARDRGVALPGETLFYTVFSYGDNGRISSGAVAALTVTQEGTEPFVPVPSEEELPLTLANLLFVQDGEVLLPDERGVVTVDSARRLSVGMLYEQLPARLKAVMITLAHPTDAARTFSFLLRANEQKTAYVATLAPLEAEGLFPFSLSVFDVETAQIGSVSAALHALQQAPQPEGGVFSVTRALERHELSFALLLLILLALAMRFIGPARLPSRAV